MSPLQEADGRAAREGGAGDGREGGETEEGADGGQAQLVQDPQSQDLSPGRTGLQRLRGLCGHPHPGRPLRVGRAV